MMISELLGLNLSKLRFYSTGIVAQNKRLDSKLIEVTPMEATPFIDGEITATLETNTSTGLDANNNSYTSTTTTSASIQATWLSLSSSNRLSAPDVRRGEIVMIYQFGDVDKYYWTTLKDDASLRRLETVIYGFSASRTENDPVNPDTMYFIEISTHRKLIHLHTCKADGEPFGYDIQLNTKEGYLTIQDDAGNYIHMNSKERRIELKNVDGSHYDMLQDNLTVTIPTTTKFITKDFLVEASNTCDIKATNTFKVATNDSKVSANSTAVMESANTTVSGKSSLTATAASVNVSGTSIDVGGGGSISIYSPSTSIV